MSNPLDSSKLQGYTAPGIEDRTIGTATFPKVSGSDKTESSVLKRTELSNVDRLQFSVSNDEETQRKLNLISAAQIRQHGPNETTDPRSGVNRRTEGDKSDVPENLYSILAQLQAILPTNFFKNVPQQTMPVGDSENNSLNGIQSQNKQRENSQENKNFTSTQSFRQSQSQNFVESAQLASNAQQQQQQQQIIQFLLAQQQLQGNGNTRNFVPMNPFLNQVPNFGQTVADRSNLAAVLLQAENRNNDANLNRNNFLNHFSTNQNTSNSLPFRNNNMLQQLLGLNQKHLFSGLFQAPEEHLETKIKRMASSRKSQHTESAHTENNQKVTNSISTVNNEERNNKFQVNLNLNLNQLNNRSNEDNSSSTSTASLLPTTVSLADIQKLLQTPLGQSLLNLNATQRNQTELNSNTVFRNTTEIDHSGSNLDKLSSLAASLSSTESQPQNFANLSNLSSLQLPLKRYAEKDSSNSDMKNFTSEEPNRTSSMFTALSHESNSSSHSQTFKKQKFSNDKNSQALFTETIDDNAELNNNAETEPNSTHLRWTYEEECFLVGLTVDCYLNHATYDWDKIALCYENCWRSFAVANNYTFKGKRSLPSLTRHFKCIKQKIRNNGKSFSLRHFFEKWREFKIRFNFEEI